MKSLVRRLIRQSADSEVKSRHFPAGLRAMLEAGAHSLPKKQLLARAVIGCVDLNLSKSQSQADVMEHWAQKQNFIAAATKYATDHDLIVLGHGSEGLTFLANYFENANWTANLMNFQEALHRSFADPGVRIGVSMGATAIGYVNDDPSTFTALGPEVDLAIRLCRQAGDNQMIVSTRVWYTLGETLNGCWNSTLTHFKVRGFDRIIPCMQLASEEGLFQQQAA